MALRPQYQGEGESEPFVQAFKRKFLDVLEVRAVVAGITLVFLIVLVGQFIGGRTETTTNIGPHKQVIAVVFVGLSTGYFLGRAAEEGEKNPTISFLIGFFGTVFALTIYLASVSHLTGILAFSMISMFLMYDSEVIEKGEDMDDFIEFSIEILGIGLGAFAVFQYLWPTIMDILGPVIKPIPDDAIMIIGSLVGIAILATVGVKIAPTIKHIISKLNYYFERVKRRYEPEEKDTKEG